MSFGFSIGDFLGIIKDIHHIRKVFCLKIPLGFTAYHLAAWFGLENTLRFLISRCDFVRARDSTNRDPLAWAALKGHTSVVKMLLDHGVMPSQHDEDGQTPISLAALNGCTDVDKLLLDYKVDPNYRGTGHKIPLIEASYGRNHETVELLLNRGAHPDPRDDYGRTPFLWACYNGSIEVVRSLLDHPVAKIGTSGASSKYCIDFFHRDVQGKDGISYALNHGNHDIIHLLRKEGFLPEQESYIDLLFDIDQLPSNWTLDSKGDTTAPPPDMGPAIGWPFMDSQGVSSHKRPSLRCVLCTESQRSYASTAHLKRHVNTTHASPSVFKCDYCARHFNRKDNLEQHLRSSHTETSHTETSHREIRGEALCRTESLNSPEKCPVCQISLRSWEEFNRCIVKHSRKISSTS